MTLCKTFTAILMLAVLASCASPRSDLKSPCAGAEGSPCERRPVNDWWLNEQG